MLRRILFVFLIIAIKSQYSFACMCVPHKIDTAFKDASAIFRGRVTEIITDKYFNYQGYPATIINFEVMEGFKKTKEGQGIISLINYNSSCDIYFDLGKEYIVFAHDLGYGHFSTSQCTKTTLIDRFERTDLNRLKHLSQVQKEDLYNYKDLMVIDKTTFKAFEDRNLELAETLRNEKLKSSFLIYTLIAICFCFTLYLIYLKRQKTANNT